METAVVSDLRSYCQCVTQLAPRSFEAYVLEHGREFSTEVAPAPAEIQGEMGLCYMNAMMAATRYPKRYTYVEGFAAPVKFPLPLRHAWLVENETGNTVDPTWAGGAAGYFGVEFSHEQILKSMVETEVYGIQDPTAL